MRPAIVKSPKPKKCKAPGCRKLFLPTRPMQAVCDWKCAQMKAEADRIKAERQKATRDRRETRAKIQRIKPKPQLVREAQAAFNAFIRERDDLLPCVSCDRHHGGQWHAGHYLSTNARPELRFDELNVWKQCQPCNTHLHGNLVLYRAELIRRIGLDQVERLEGPHAAKHYTREELIDIATTYRARLRELKKGKQ